MSNSCEANGTCINDMLQQMTYPTDEKSLYADRIYDSQVAAYRCHGMMGPSIPIPRGPVEGFGRRIEWRKILQFLVIACMILLFVGLLREPCLKVQESSSLMGGYANLGDSMDSVSDLDLTPIHMGGYQF